MELKNGGKFKEKPLLEPLQFLPVPCFELGEVAMPPPPVHLPASASSLLHHDSSHLPRHVLRPLASSKLCLTPIVPKGFPIRGHPRQPMGGNMQTSH